MIPLAGHGSIRIAVMGFEARQAKPDEIAGMRRILETAFEQGAFGFSTGLIYPPGINSPTDELVALCRVVAENDRFYATHLRGDTPFKAPKLVDSLMEALSVMRNTGSRLHVSHADAKFPEQRFRGRDDRIDAKGPRRRLQRHLRPPSLPRRDDLSGIVPAAAGVRRRSEKGLRAAQIPHGTGWDRQGPRRNLQPSRCRKNVEADAGHSPRRRIRPPPSRSAGHCEGKELEARRSGLSKSLRKPASGCSK